MAGRKRIRTTPIKGNEQGPPLSLNDEIENTPQPATLQEQHEKETIEETRELLNYNPPRTTKAIYDSDLHPGLAERACVLFGADLTRLSKLFGISTKVLKSWRVSHPDLAEAIQKGRDTFDSTIVESSLLRRALGYDYMETRTETVELTGKLPGTKITVKIPGLKTVKQTKHVLADPVSMIFYLTNRSPERYKNTRFVEATQGGTINHKFVNTDELSSEELKVLDGAMNKVLGAVPKASNVVPFTGKKKACGTR